MKLQKIDLRRGDGKNHPDFNEADTYLVKHGSNFFVGNFEKVWFREHSNRRIGSYLVSISRPRQREPALVEPISGHEKNLMRQTS